MTNDTYTYDIANRLIDVNGVTYTWDDNGILLSDGVNTYAYDSANRLTSLTSPSATMQYAYNGLNDRLQETANGVTTSFTMDLNPSTSLRAGSGLTQALSDGTYHYLYGNGRIAQLDAGTQAPEYFLGDALGSVRQMTDATGAITYARSYDPYGVVAQTGGTSQTAYGYTGEFQRQGLVYLRARYYAPGMGRFLTRDIWNGDYRKPLSLNHWTYVEGNPIILTDPKGNYPIECQVASSRSMYEACILSYYDLEPIDPHQMGATVEGSKGCYKGPSYYRAPGYIGGIGVLTVGGLGYGI